ncbi:Trichodiene oxygenase [Apiospora aurea]|uniref:Trichodiene oxygenase n=1 Tax=Apiospora aurea TaxID=335848 RepID=A0ABR1Q293_9PEZI
MRSLLDQLSWKHVIAPIAVYFLTLAFYRLFLHPLAGFPGPKLAAITRYVEAYYDVVCGGQYTFKLAEMHKKYGPIIRISPYELHISDPSFYEKLYNREGRWDKYDWTWNAFGAPSATICSVKHEAHKHRRAALNPFFSKTSVAKRVGIIQRLASELCRKVDSFAVSESSQISMSAAISAFVRDVSTEFVIGKQYHILDAQDLNADVAVLFQGTGNLWRRTKHIPWYGSLLRYMPTSLVKKTSNHGVTAFVFFLQDMMKVTSDYFVSLRSAATDPDAPRTIVHEILDSELPPDEKSMGRVFQEVGTISGAGNETVAGCLSMILYHVYANQTILVRLRSELVAARHEPGPSLTVLENLPYLTAVLMEGLRLSPALATRAQRIAPDRDLVYNGQVIPAGTPVGMTTLLMHTDPDIYPDPTCFDPERWVDMDVRRKAEKTYAPFGRGTRMCLGMYLAWAELYMVVSTLVERFDLEFDPAALGDLECTSDEFLIGTTKRNGLRAYVKRVGI